MTDGSPRVMLAGTSHPAAREFLATASDKGFPGEVVAVASYSSVGKLVGDTALKGFSEYDGLRVIGLHDAMHADADVVVSFLQDEAARINEDALAQDRLVISGSAANAMRDDVAMANPYTNPTQIDEMLQLARKDRNGGIIATGHSASIIASTAMAPIHRAWHIERASVDTLQSWRGAGYDQVPAGQEQLIPPITGDDQVSIESDPGRLLSPSVANRANLDITATPKHGPWIAGGHHEVIAVELERPASEEGLREVWHDWRSPKMLRVKYGPNSPQKRPIKTQKQPLIHWDGTVPKLTKSARPMQVRAHLRDIQDEGHKVVFEVIGHDLALGTAGSVAMILAYARNLGYWDRET